MKINIRKSVMVIWGLFTVMVWNSSNAQAPMEMQDFRDVPGIGLPMVWLPKGTFLMGSPEFERDRQSDEQIHQVSLDSGFYIGRFEVTKSEWARVFMGFPGGPETDYIFPVENVTWFEAMEFCRLLTIREAEAGRLPEGLVFTLPTEAQWEYACRQAGRKATAWQDGDTISDKEANLDIGINVHGSLPVGSTAPNKLGIFELHGNVREWCLDWYGPYSKADQTNPAGSITGSRRVVRGGSWFNFPAQARCAARQSFPPDFRSNTLGFRICLGPNARLRKAFLDLNIPEHGADWTVPELGLPMKFIHSGSFMMGSHEEEEGRNNNEILHEVKLSMGYWLGAYEVTQKEWTTIMGTNPSKFTGQENLPVENVHWEDCMEFCIRLTQREREAGRLPLRLEYTLPTEAQWEFACRDRGFVIGPFHFGDSLSSLQANFWGDHPYGNAEKGPFLKKTAVVGTYDPNRLGLYDMQGNVAEWCFDWYGDYSSESQVDPTGPPAGMVRVYRNGSWTGSAAHCRAASRGGLKVNYKSNEVGFRLALGRTK